MSQNQIAGRTLYDFLSELVSSSKSWFFILLFLGFIIFIHFQTEAGKEVKLLGISLYEKSSSEPQSSNLKTTTPQVKKSSSTDGLGDFVLILEKVILSESKLTVQYAKNFRTNVHLLTKDGQFVTKRPFQHISKHSFLLTDLDIHIKIGSELKICHGNDRRICSELVKVQG